MLWLECSYQPDLASNSSAATHCCVTLGKSLHLSEPCVPHLYNVGNDNTTSRTVMGIWYDEISKGFT